MIPPQENPSERNLPKNLNLPTTSSESSTNFEIPYKKLDLQHADEIKEKLLVLLKAAKDEDTPPWMENKKKSAEHDIKVIEKYNKYGNHH